MSATLESAASNAQPSSGDTRMNASESLSQQACDSSFWRGSAPASAHEQVGADSAWLAAYFADRSSPTPLMTRCGGQWPFEWGWGGPADSDPARDLLQLLNSATPNKAAARKKGVRRKAAGSKSAAGRIASKQLARLEGALEAWLQQAEVGQPSVEWARSCLVAAHALAAAPSQLPQQLSWRVLDALSEAAARAADWRSDADLPAEAALAQQLLAGELPLTLAYLFPEMKPLHCMRHNARQRLTEGIEELLNGEGLWHSSIVPVARPLIACWTRCRAMGEAFKKGPWTPEAEEQFHLVATTALQWSAADGAPLLTDGDHAVPWSPAFLQTLLRLAGDAADKAAARELLGKKINGPGKLNPRAAQPEAADHCEWSSLAVMRTDWAHRGPVVAIDYDSQQLRLELAIGAQRILSGEWQASASVDGESLQPVGQWEEVCWVSDEDVDYLEVSIELTGGATLERQILLAHDEGFVFLADNVKTGAGEQLEYAWELPIRSEEIDCVPAEETCEVNLHAGKPIARLLPLALPEWRVDSSVGQLTARDGVLRLDCRQQGQSLVAPLLIDINPRRVSKQCTWRQLTVAEALEVVPRDVAVGFRAQLGKDQYLFYRSLGPAANRTVLGQNLASECFFAKFLPPFGDVEELLEVEA